MKGKGSQKEARLERLKEEIVDILLWFQIVQQQILFTTYLMREKCVIMA